jgi:hypothetical protein
MESIPGGTYGANGGSNIADFDLMEFIRRPTTICRLISILFAIVVFGCISGGGYDNQVCIFNENSDACHYGVAIGVLAFLACLLFLAVDVQFSSINNAAIRRQLQTADLGFSGIWSFLWFVGFCFLADQWRRSHILLTNQNNHARAAIAFSFFSVFSWIILTLMAIQRYRQGDGFQYNQESSAQPREYQGGYNSNGSNFARSPYASFPQPTSEESSMPPVYQQQSQPTPEQPFGVPPQAPVKTEYSVPNY